MLARVHALYVFSVWLHILAATTWVGGMAFLVLVVVPYLRSGDRQRGAALLRDTGTRFRNVGWTCFAIVLVTGTFNLHARGVRLSDLTQLAWLGSETGRAVILKLTLFALVLALSGVHDFFVGPAATRAIERDPRAPEAERYRKMASWMGRITALLALGLVFAGVVIVRGWP
ncbi:MAG: CopD family protein [Sandaracinus sp.]